MAPCRCLDSKHCLSTKMYKAVAVSSLMVATGRATYIRLEIWHAFAPLLHKCLSLFAMQSGLGLLGPVLDH